MFHWGSACLAVAAHGAGGIDTLTSSAVGWDIASNISSSESPMLSSTVAFNKPTVPAFPLPVLCLPPPRSLSLRRVLLSLRRFTCVRFSLFVVSLLRFTLSLLPFTCVRFLLSLVASLASSSSSSSSLQSLHFR